MGRVFAWLHKIALSLSKQNSDPIPFGIGSLELILLMNSYYIAYLSIFSLIFSYRKTSKLKAIINVIITLKHYIETKLTLDTIANITHMANVLLNSRNSRIRPECPSCCYRKIYRWNLSHVVKLKVRYNALGLKIFLCTLSF